MKLLIVESPSKTKKIAEYLGPGWRVEASFGHIRDLPSGGDIGISRPDYSLDYRVLETKRAQVSKLRTAAAQADDVYLATDPDREGEAIAWHLMDELRLKAPKRVTFQVITEKAVRAAVAAPRTVDLALVRAQEARRALDRLVGWEVSPILLQLMRSAKFNEQVSAGRVQTPAVLLCALREDEIEAFKRTKHFTARVHFDGDAWSAEMVTKGLLKPGEAYLLDESIAAMAAACREFKVVKSDTKPVSRNPPAPFTTSTLQQAASAALGMSPAATQKIAQKLFEQGLITYHRTDSMNLSDEAISAIRAFAVSRNWPLPETPRRWKAKGGAQEAHEAIRPASIALETAGGDENERRLYRLIWERAVASQLAAAEYDETSVVLEARDGARPGFTFQARGKVMTAAGWTVVTAKDAADEEDDDGEGTTGRVPRLAEGSQKTAERGEVIAKETTPPKRYTEAGLVQALERHGIGRPATYATIIENIKKREFVSLKGKTLVATALGRGVIQQLRGHFSFVELDFTRAAEKLLDTIAEGRAQYIEVVSEFDRQLQGEIGHTGVDPAAVLKPTEKALAYAEGMATRLGTELPAAARETGAALRTWIDKHKSSVPPSAKALEFAKTIAGRLGIDVPAEAAASSDALTKWIDKHKGAADTARMASEPASEGQIKVVAKLIDEGRVEPPEGWPSISKRAASDLMDSVFGGKMAPAPKRSAKTQGTRRKARASGK